MALAIGRSECDSKLAAVPNSVQNFFLFDTFLYKQKTFSKFELSHKS